MLHLMKNSQFYKRVSEGSSFTLENNDVVSPAYAGWSAPGYLLVQAPAEEPPPPPTVEELRIEMRLSFAQLLIGLVTEGWITDTEGREWLRGIVPNAINWLIGQMPPEQQFVALARATRPETVLRLDPLVIALGNAEGKTAEQIDTFFTTYSLV